MDTKSLEIAIFEEPVPWLQVFTKFGLANKPFLFGSWITQEWAARRLWVNPDGTPCLTYLRKVYGESHVPLHRTIGGYSNVRLTDYLDSSACSTDATQYLKDWHFQKTFGTDDYVLHPFFARDWINCEAWTDDSQENPFGEDYRFVYIGVAGTWTKFHSDVVASHSWSANICGRKQWYMIPAGNEKLFSDSRGDFFEDIRLHRELWEEAGVISFVQEEGQLVFVPSNWHHQVHNLTDAISINHNWINATNIEVVANFVHNRLVDVRRELECSRQYFTPEEFDEQIEKILFADARLNVSRLKKFLKKVADDRLQKIDSCFVCPEHLYDLKKCFGDSNCHDRMESVCSCKTTTCSACTNFMDSFEATLVLLLLTDMLI